MSNTLDHNATVDAYSPDAYSTDSVQANKATFSSRESVEVRKTELPTSDTHGFTEETSRIDMSPISELHTSGELALAVLPESLRRIDIALEKTDRDFAALHSSIEWQLQAISDSVIRGHTVGVDEHRDSSTALPTIFGVTSALTGEGKTTIALHLALQIARNSFRHVCLIDFGLQEDSILRLLGTQVETGATDVLEGRGTALHTFRLDGYGNLSVIPSGPAPDNAARAARSPSIPEILLAAQQMFDIVIVDMPSLSSGNALPISAHLDRVLLVANSGITSKRLLQDAANRIGKHRLLGVILNRVKSATPQWLANRLTAL